MDINGKKVEWLKNIVYWKVVDSKTVLCYWINSWILSLYQPTSSLPPLFSVSFQLGPTVLFAPARVNIFYQVKILNFLFSLPKLSDSGFKNAETKWFDFTVCVLLSCRKAFAVLHTFCLGSTDENLKNFGYPILTASI